MAAPQQGEGLSASPTAPAHVLLLKMLTLFISGGACIGIQPPISNVLLDVYRQCCHAHM